MIGAYLADHVVPQPMGTAYGALLPYQTFRTTTRDIAIGIGSDKLWRTFCPLIGLPQVDLRQLVLVHQLHQPADPLDVENIALTGARAGHRFFSHRL